MRGTGWKRWTAYRGKAKGTFIQGDPRVPTTRWWNHLWLLWWGWKTVAIFEVRLPSQLSGNPMALGPHAAVRVFEVQSPPPAFRYRIGFRNQWGRAFLLDHVVTEPTFAMRIGREDCYFFAVDVEGNDEFPLALVERTNRKDPRYADVPLY